MPLTSWLYPKSGARPPTPRDRLGGQHVGPPGSRHYGLEVGTIVQLRALDNAHLRREQVVDRYLHAREVGSLENIGGTGQRVSERIG